MDIKSNIKEKLLIIWVLLVATVALIIGIFGFVLRDKEIELVEKVSVCGVGEREINSKTNYAFPSEFAQMVQDTLKENSEYTVNDAIRDYQCEIEIGEYDWTTVHIAIEYAMFLNSYRGSESGIVFLTKYYQEKIDATDSEEDMAEIYVDLGYSLYKLSRETGQNYYEDAIKYIMNAEESAPTWTSAFVICLSWLELGNIDEAKYYYKLAVQRGFDDSEGELKYRIDNYLQEVG